MILCLDTNAYSDWTHGKAWLNEISTAERVLIPSVVLGELREGFLCGSRKVENERMLAEVIRAAAVEVVDVGDATSAVYAELKDFLKRRGTPIPVNDIWIAACAIERGAVLLTRDSHFKRLPQVRVI